MQIVNALVCTFIARNVYYSVAYCDILRTFLLGVGGPNSHVTALHWKKDPKLQWKEKTYPLNDPYIFVVLLKLQCDQEKLIVD